jgi:molybdopterin converting factor small subunit
MTTKVNIPTPLRPYTEGHSVVNLEGQTIDDILIALARKFPRVHTHLLDEKGELRAFVNVYLNTADIRYLQKQQTLIKPGDIIWIVPSVAGG